VLAIEFLIIPEADKKWHCALLLRNNYKHPEVIVLFEEKEVSSFLSTSNGNITNQTYDFYANGDTISKLVWSKFLPYINEGETIYFAPSGLLHQLAIEYLPYDENRTMSDVYNMVRLSSTREIVLNKQDTEYTTATIYGGIVYDTDTATMQYESRDYNRSLFDSQELENDTTNRGSVKYLYGTKIEAEYVDALLKNNNITVKLYTATKANEESFKALSGKHNNILHIGTHGFTWTDSIAKKQDFFAQRVQLMGQEQYYDTSIDPLNRCGLLFAGANIALQGNSKNLPEGVQDGILTAKEISLMDLRDANLVVLSACETAKGDITSEGVFGLQRAFKMAGVQTIIMSLWKVNDQATQLLMTEFYNNWIGKHQSKREAFRNAQNTVRNKYEEPEYWAGFIMLD
jgi:CHAT domain-containing protein